MLDELLLNSSKFCSSKVSQISFRECLQVFSGVLPSKGDAMHQTPAISAPCRLCWSPSSTELFLYWGTKWEVRFTLLGDVMQSGRVGKEWLQAGVCFVLFCGLFLKSCRFFFFLSSLLNERNFKRNSRRQFKSSHRILDKASSHMHGSSVPLIPSTHCVSPALFPRPSVSQLVATSNDTSISSRADTKIQAFRSAGIPRRMQNLLCVPQTIWLSFPRAQQPG